MPCRNTVTERSGTEGIEGERTASQRDNNQPPLPTPHTKPPPPFSSTSILLLFPLPPFSPHSPHPPPTLHPPPSTHPPLPPTSTSSTFSSHFSPPPCASLFLLPPPPPPFSSSWRLFLFFLYPPPPLPSLVGLDIQSQGQVRLRLYLQIRHCQWVAFSVLIKGCDEDECGNRM